MDDHGSQNHLDNFCESRNSSLLCRKTGSSFHQCRRWNVECSENMQCHPVRHSFHWINVASLLGCLPANQADWASGFRRSDKHHRMVVHRFHARPMGNEKAKQCLESGVISLLFRCCWYGPHDSVFRFAIDEQTVHCMPADLFVVSNSKPRSPSSKYDSIWQWPHSPASGHPWFVGHCRSHHVDRCQPQCDTGFTSV